MMHNDSPSWPVYRRSEIIADGVVHAIGVTLAITGTVLLIVFAALWAQGGAGQVAALSVYGGAIIVSFIASAVYNMTPWLRSKAVLQRIDHAAIYLKIAGTYTPLVVLIGTTFAWFVLGLVWVLAVVGALLKLVRWRTPGRFGPLLYLGLGWLALLLFWPLAQSVPLAALILVMTGGLLYSIGTIFFGMERLMYSNAIWHVFVLAASGCFYAAITVGVFA